MTTDELIERLTKALEDVVEHDRTGGVWLSFDEISAKCRESLALARQHKGGWRHLDRDEEKPEDEEIYTVWHSAFEKPLNGRYYKSQDRFIGLNIFPANPRWWMPLPALPKD